MFIGFVRPLVIKWTEFNYQHTFLLFWCETLNHNLDFRLVSKRDGGDHKRSPPSCLLTSVKILTSQAVVSIVLT